MKKIFIFALAFIMLLSLTSCNAIGNITGDYVRENMGDEYGDMFDEVMEQNKEDFEQLAEDTEELTDILKDEAEKAIDEEYGDEADEVKETLSKAGELWNKLFSSPTVSTYINDNGEEVITLTNFPNSVNDADLWQYPLNSHYPSSGYYCDLDGDGYNEEYVAAGQCFGFARYVQLMLYGEHDCENKNFVIVDGSDDISGSELTEDKLKELINAAGPGAHLRTGTSNKHSMILAEVTDDGFTVIDANGAKSVRHTVEMRTYTWNEYLNGRDDYVNYGKRGFDYIKVYQPQE